MKVKKLSTNEAAEAPGYTHVASITADDLTTNTANTVQTITICPFAAGDAMLRLAWHLKTPFQLSTDNTFASLTVSVGDDSAVTTHLAAAEANVNGTEIIWRWANTAVGYTAANTLKAAFTPGTGRNVNEINRGELLLYFALARLKSISDSIASAAIAKT